MEICHFLRKMRKHARPHEIEKYFNKDAKIFNCPNLHAKMFVFDDTLIVGSTNVSSSVRKSIGGGLPEGVVPEPHDRPQSLTIYDGRHLSFGDTHSWAYLFARQGKAIKLYKSWFNLS